MKGFENGLFMLSGIYSPAYKDVRRYIYLDLEIGVFVIRLFQASDNGDKISLVSI